MKKDGNYSFQELEAKWQKYWADNNLFVFANNENTFDGEALE